MKINAKIVFFGLILISVLTIVYVNMGIGIINITKLLPRHSTKRFGRRSLEDITEVVIHHTATDSASTTIDSIARYHVEPGNHICDDGCPGISYHFMIKPSGAIYQVNDLETISYQCGGCNSYTIGICLIGNFNEEVPAEKALKAVAKTIRHVNRKLGRSLTISAHYHHKSTSCPGDNTDVDRIIEMVYP
ncbi:MAG: N-acetylmuramoyl-L-alanine amidase, partial [Bacteroidetes bacterium]